MRVRLRDDAIEPDAEMLQRGKSYTVYAITLSAPIQFLIEEEDALSFPFFVSSELFDVVDSELSKYMHYSSALPSSEVFSSRPPLLAFHEMAIDRLFYQRLVDGEEPEKGIWARVKALM